MGGDLNGLPTMLQTAKKEQTVTCLWRWTRPIKLANCSRKQERSGRKEIHAWWKSKYESEDAMECCTASPKLETGVHVEEWQFGSVANVVLLGENEGLGLAADL